MNMILAGLVIVALVVLNIVTIFMLFRFNKSLKLQKEEIEQIIDYKESHAQNQIDFLAKFLARVSYEIRGSLNAVLGFNDLILDKKNLDVEVIDSALKIRDSGVALLSIVNDIADVSRIEEGKSKLHLVDYDTAELINKVISTNATGIKSKLIKFVLDINENLPSRLIGDEFRVKQVFVNILSNALKSAKSGVVEWHLGFEQEGEGHVWLVSRVKLEKAFEGADLGLELVLAKRNVDIMEGYINIESEPDGKASIFTVKIKQQLQNNAPIGESWNKDDKEKLVFDQMPHINVLIVDDVLLNLEVAQGLMSRYGMRVDTAPSGQVAIAKVMNKSKKYSAIFMDYMMPEMDGIETVRKIRDLDTDYAKDIPIIALTADVLDASGKMFLEKGFNDFMSKPIDIMKLDAILKKWVMNK
jgi:CheY-like chemotaxis protein